MDAVVIGSGPNGLAAAITLAEAGFEVTVLEAAERPGGALATAELTLPGFRHDVFSAVHPAGAASPVFARMGLERHGLRWVHPRHCYAQPLAGGRAAVHSRDLGETAASLDALHPGDGAAWRAFAAPYLEHFEAWRAVMLAGFPPLRGAARTLAAHGPAGALRQSRVMLEPARALAGRLFAHEGSRAWLYGSAMHGDVPVNRPGSAVAAVHLMLLGHASGWPSPEGGAERLAGALAGRLAELGGRIRTGAPATGVAVEHGRVAAVVVAGQERLPAQIVVATVSVPELLRLAGHALPARYARRLRRFRPGPPTTKLDWALDGPIPWTAPVVGGAGTVHVGGPGDRPFLLLGQQSVADPTRAPAGRHTAWAYTHDRAATPEEVEAQVERHAPGFRERILARYVLTPAELERRDANLVGGDVGGGSYRLDQAVFRPLVARSPYRTPLAGLHLGSAAAFPGGGVHGVPGDAAARAALRDHRLRGG